MAKLGDLGKVITGNTPKTSDPQNYASNDICFVKPSDIADGIVTYLNDSEFYISEYARAKARILPPKSVLVTCIGIIGKVAINNVECAFNQQINAIVPDKSKCLTEYLAYAIQNKQEEMQDIANAPVVPILNKTQFSDIEIKLPSLSEQKNIIQKLNAVSKLITLRKEQLAKLDQLVKSRFIELFGDPETNPYGWELATVGDVCSSIVRGPFGSALKKEFFVEPDETTYKVYEQKHAIQKSATIGTYYVTAEKFDELRRFECVAGDILMSCSGTMGELYQLPEGCEKGLINQALCKFTLNERILPIVFLTYMKQTIGNLETKGSGIQNIAAVSYVKAMPINLAPVEVQEQFATFVEQTDKSKLAIQKSLEQLETLKKALMQKYFG